MLNDIEPPRRLKTSPHPKVMRSQRLRGHTPVAAKTRLKSQAPLRPDETLAIDSKGNVAEPARLRHPHFFWRMTKKNRIIFASSTAVIFGLILSAFFIFFPHKDPVQPAPTIQVKAEPPKPTTVASPLSGVQVAPELAQRPVTAIMVENSIDARPQSGLHEAGVVFEAIAEGGITRFMALYQDTQPAYVGPVRSLRPYYIDFAAPFQASIAHVGGSPEALAQIRGGGFRDIDQFFNAGAYWRAGNRPAPHNVYTSFQRLDELNRAKGYTSSPFTPWVRKEDQKLAAPTAAKININISSALYNSAYEYDGAQNAYLRLEGGRPHISTASAEDATGHRLAPKVVIALEMPYSLNGKYSVYGVNGSGAMFVFQDGGVAQGTWSKADRASPFVFKDAAGNPLAINAGQTWVTLVRSASMVTFTP